MSIAAIYGSLSARRPDTGKVPPLPHLGEIGEGLQAGLLPPGVTLTFQGDAVTVPATVAVTVGLVVNEWITNAIKYAFPDGKGEIHVDLACGDDMIVLQVRDNGVGLPADQRAGGGSRLILRVVGHLPPEDDARDPLERRRWAPAFAGATE